MRTYVASRASIPARSEMWRAFRSRGCRITSTWIDEVGENEVDDFVELWDRICGEIVASDRLVLYAEPDDFPLKGALIETGIAIGLRKPIIVCLPGVNLSGRTFRPIGSWIRHRLVVRIDDVDVAMTGSVR